MRLSNPHAINDAKNQYQITAGELQQLFPSFAVGL
jgi:hypothetical protein